MSQQTFKRGRGAMRFKPSHGLGAPKPNRAATNARAEAIGEKSADERFFDIRRHEAEIRRAENLAAGLPEDARDTADERNLTKSGRDQSFRAPDFTRPEEVSEEQDADAEGDTGAGGGAPAGNDRGERDRGRDRGRGGRDREGDTSGQAQGGRDGQRPQPKGLIDRARAAVKEVVKKVRRLINPEPKTVKEVVINTEPLETRVAVLEDSKLEDFTVERTNDDRLVGSIYKGKVKNLEDNLKAAFVDIGFEKNAFLHYWDIVPNNFDSSVEIIERDDRRKPRREKAKITQRDVPRLYPPGAEIIVQVTKGAIGTKGPRVTTNLALPGRYLVLLPNSDQSGISRKIENGEERQRLKKIVRELTIPEGMGVIIRTAGEGRLKRYFIRDLAMLLDEWHQIEERIKNQPLASCVFQEPDLIERTVRDFLTEDVTRIVIDDNHQYERVRTMIERISKRSAKKIQFYNEAQPLFDRFNITKQLDQAFSRQVHLKSGGHLVIDETEALVAIDVNTGRHKGGKDHDNAILKVNLEAADEICRQLRLRNIGGIIVLDFIDMKSRKDQQSVCQRVKEGLKRDKAKTHVLPLSQLGLMEMTRQRHTESVRSSLYEDCTHCRGRGVIKSAETMSVEIQRKLTAILKGRPRDESDFQVKIVCNPQVLDRLRTRDEKLLIDLEKKFFAKLGFRPDPTFHNEEWAFYNALTNEEIARSQTTHEHT